MANLLDSGARRNFDSGAVRDVVEGKGRCDLLPLAVVARLISKEGAVANEVLLNIDLFVQHGTIESLYHAIYAYCIEASKDIYTVVLEAAKQFEDGAKKYDDRNWEKGIPLHWFIDSGVRHYLKYRRGDTDEPHDRAFLWNIFCAIWTFENLPYLRDLPFVQKGDL